MASIKIDKIVNNSSVSIDCNLLLLKNTGPSQCSVKFNSSGTSLTLPASSEIYIFNSVDRVLDKLVFTFTNNYTSTNDVQVVQGIYDPITIGGVMSVTGLDTDNTDPANPIVQISVDNVTITGDGTPTSPLVAASASPQGLPSVLGIDSSADFGEIKDIDFLNFWLSSTKVVGIGELAWNSTDGTLDLGLQGGLINRLGQQLVVKARNMSGSLISKGSVVRVVGVSGGFIGINLAQADNDTNSATAFGIVAEDIANTSNGFVAINGIIHGLNTNAFTEGDILYLSPTVAGEITNVKPSSPSHIVVIGYVAKKSAVDGHILLHVQNGYELNELHDVTITSAVNNDALLYESATSLWKNKTIGGWNYIVKSANQDVTNSATLTDDTELQFSVVAGGQYMVELNAVISANNTTGDYTNAFFVSSGTMKGQGIQTCNTATAVAQVVSINTNAANVSTITPMGTLIADIDMISSIKIIYSFTASANAVFSYRFSNAAAGVGRISRTWKGSILKYKKIN